MNCKNKNIILEYEGAGIMDYFNNLFSANSQYTNKAQNALKKYGNYEIVNMEVRRDPIIKVIDTALNLVSLGKWEELKKKYNFDKLWHLYMIFTINMNGQRKDILVEKNQSINISDSIPPKTEQTKSLMIGTNKGLTLNSLLENTLNKVGKDQFFIYDPFGDRNCQSFLRDLMTANGIYNDRIAKFVFQDIADLAKQIGNTTVIAKGITDLNIKYSKPFIFGVLTTNTEEQALDRVGGKHGNKGDEAAVTAIKMLGLQNSFNN
jgi:hypothetical protein